MHTKRSSQAFDRFDKALANLERTLTLPEGNEDYRNSTILAFLLAEETVWKALKWILKEEVGIDISGPKPVLKEAYQQEWLGEDDKLWLGMVDDRNNVSHTYNEETAKAIYQNIKTYALAMRYTHGILSALYKNLA